MPMPRARPRMREVDVRVMRGDDEEGTVGVQLSTQGAIGEVTAAVGRQLEEELQLRDAFKLYWADAEGELTLVGKTTQMRDLVDASELVARLAEGALRSAPLLPLKGPPGALAVLDDDDDDDAESEEGGRLLPAPAAPPAPAPAKGARAARGSRPADSRPKQAPAGNGKPATAAAAAGARNRRGTRSGAARLGRRGRSGCARYQTVAHACDVRLRAAAGLRASRSSVTGSCTAAAVRMT